MRKLGISIYVEKDETEVIKKYIDDASAAGFSRIFSCLLSVEDEIDEVKSKFIEINNYAKERGFEIIVDVAPSVFSKLGITYDNLSFFKEIGADGIRLDEGFSGAQEAMMTYNEHDLKIEFNMSIDTHYIDTIFDYQPNPYGMLGCHNFYPHRYTGLAVDYFTKCSKHFKKYGLRTAAFITSQNKDTYGPWPVTDGLCTLEMHRDLPLATQIKHFVSMGNIDDIIISNCYPTKAELEEVSKVSLRNLNLKVELIDGLPEVEKAIVLEEFHFNRGDVNEYVVRSTQSRVKYKGHKFELLNAPEMLKKGDVIIESELYGHYAGELHIVKKDMPNSGKTSVVGKVVSEELFLIDTIKPWQKFTFYTN